MKQRILTAVIAAAFFIPIVILGGLPFTILVYAMATVALYEILKMKGLSLFSVPGLISLFALFVFLLPTNWANQLMDLTSYTKIDLALITILILLTYIVVVKNRFNFDDAAFSILGALYIGIGFFYFVETRMAGIEYVIFALGIVWTTDSGAYFIGKKFGKNKLWPDISPNKTIEGFFGGIITAIVFALIFQFISPFPISIIALIIVTIIASIFGQIGDLVESALKRQYQVKDSGDILPGHGGILDRFDSLLFVLPLLHFLHFVA